MNSCRWPLRWLGRSLFLSSSVVGIVACSSQYVDGPDKQFVGTVAGAASGAGSGAVTGFQIGSGVGPGALVGAGLGAVAGGIEGALSDASEEQIKQLQQLTDREGEAAWVHSVLARHYQRRLELHPSRDIYPADLFFRGDETQLSQGGKALVRELARLNKERLGWSRLAVAAYVRAADPESAYARHLAERRSREISDLLVMEGIEPRRIETRAVIMKGPLVLDPDDRPERYSQAVELIPVDR